MERLAPEATPHRLQSSQDRHPLNRLQEIATCLTEQCICWGSICGARCDGQPAVALPHAAVVPQVIVHLHTVKLRITQAPCS